MIKLSDLRVSLKNAFKLKEYFDKINIYTIEVSFSYLRVTSANCHAEVTVEDKQRTHVLFLEKLALEEEECRL